MDIKNMKESMVFNEKTFTKRVLLANKDILCFVLNLIPGQVLPEHKHENSSLVFHVMTGSGEVKINEEVVKISTGSVVSAKGEDDFSIPTVTENLSLFVVISPNPSSHLYSQSLG